MRNFTLFVAVAVTSMFTTGAAASTNYTGITVPAGIGTTTGSNGKSMFSTAVPMASQHKATQKLTVGNAKPTDNTIYSEAPAGVHTDYSRASDAFGVAFGMLIFAEDSGLTVDYVEGEDGCVYISNPFSQFPLKAYLKCQRNGDKVTFTGAQAVFAMPETDDNGNPTGNIVYCYACPMVPRATADGGEWYFADTKSTVEFTVKDNALELDPEAMIGLFLWDEEQKDLAWTGYGDYNMRYKAVTSSLIAPPADLATERWSMILDDGTGYFVNVGSADNALYIKGIYPNTPNAWVKLDVNEGKAVLNDVQYLGKDDNWHYAYAVGGTVENKYIEEWDDYMEVATPTGVLSFSYDPAERVLETEGAFIICTEENCTAYSSYYPTISIMQQNHVAGTAPLAPQGLYTAVYEEGSQTLEFAIPMLDVDGALLETSNLSYRVFVDGELFDFYNDEYVKLPEATMNEFPWGFTEDYDFYAMGVYHSVYFYINGYESIGVQTVYHEPETNAVLYSSITAIDAEGNIINGIESVAQGTKAVKSVDYFDLQGRRVATPAKGLNIVRTTYADGTTDTRKTIVR